MSATDDRPAVSAPSAVGRPPLENDAADTRIDADNASSDPDSATVRHNLRSLVAFHVSLRCGWVFKVETVVMPAVLDVLSGAGWVRGCLPILNKAAQSFAPLLAADWLRHRPRKSRMLTGTAAAMSACFLLLSGLWLLRGMVPPPVLTAGFLAIYTAFFAASGLNLLAFNTTQGKLIPAIRRGRLLWLGGTIGSVAAVALAYLLMPGWLALPDGDGFLYFFLMTATGFAVASAMTFAVRERPTVAKHDGPDANRRGRLAGVPGLVRTNAAFRRAAIVAGLAVSGQILFPHYQWLGRQSPDIGPQSLMVWLLVQTLAVGVYSPVSGIVADRLGNRLALRTVIALSLIPPGLLVAFAAGAIDMRWYAVVFVALGLIPVLAKTIFNYVLELVDEDEQPIAIAAIQFWLIVPSVSAPFAGLLLDWSDDPRRGLIVLAAVVMAAIGVSVVGSFSLVEPRHGETSLAENERG